MEPNVNLFSEIRTASNAAVRRAHSRAVTLGGELGEVDCHAGGSRDSHAAMCASADMLVDMALVTHTLRARLGHLHGTEHDSVLEVAGVLREVSASGVGWLRCALDLHAGEVGYRVDAWRERAVEMTQEVLVFHSEPGVMPAGSMPVAVARASIVELLDGLDASGRDRMAVPEHLAAATGYTAALFMLASALMGVGERP